MKTCRVILPSAGEFMPSQTEVQIPESLEECEGASVSMARMAETAGHYLGAAMLDAMASGESRQFTIEIEPLPKLSGVVS